MTALETATLLQTISIPDQMLAQSANCILEMRELKTRAHQSHQFAIFWPGE
jgi:hypothetical protein